MIDNLILWKCFLEDCTRYVHLESSRKMFTILFTNIKVWSLRTIEIEFLDRLEEHKQNMYRNSQKKHKRTHLTHTHTHTHLATEAVVCWDIDGVCQKQIIDLFIIDSSGNLYQSTSPSIWPFINYLAAISIHKLIHTQNMNVWKVWA